MSNSSGGYLDTPVIGVLCQDLSVSLQQKYLVEDGPAAFTSSLCASYVKFAEDSRGRCLPIALNQNFDYYRHIVGIVDGILLPGGSFSLKDSKGYTQSGKLLLDAVTSAADGRIIPVFGICLGFELMAVYFASKCNELKFDVLRQIERNKGYQSVIFREDEAPSQTLSAELLEMLQQNNLFSFNHQICLPFEEFRRLEGEWRALATIEVKQKQEKVESGNKLTAVAIMKSKSKPYFGTQFHPEKPKHESKEKCPDLKSAETAEEVFNTILTTMIEAQNIPHNFPESECKRLIERFTPEDIRADTNIKYDYVYMFKDGDLVID